MKNYLIIGNGVAGTTAAESIRKQDNVGSITIVTDEKLPFYYRIKLNDYISGDVSEQELLAKKEQWYKDLSIDLRLKTRVVGGDPQKQIIFTDDNQKFSYDRLLLATGSHPCLPPIKGSEKKGVFTLRSIQDAQNISGYANNVKEVVLIGGGLLGLETGNALRKLGVKVTVVEFCSRLLPRQLDEEGAQRLQRILEEMGLSFKLGAKTEGIIGNDRVSGVLLEGGETLEAQMVVISAGVRANMELASTLGLEAGKGIKADNRLRTNQPNIYAAGDVAEFKGISYGIWPAAMEQGKIAGTNMAGGDLIYSGTTMANHLKVVGVDLASAGDIDPEGKFDSRVIREEKIYKKIVIKDNRIIGCIMLGDTTEFIKTKQLITQKKDISQIQDRLLYSKT